MTAYVMTALAMCLIVLVALVGTAYLAVYFNRRGKADLQAALEPLAAAIDGSVNLDEAEVTGRRGRWPVYGRMANASEGPGRVFQVEVVDAAGGESWQYTSNPPRGDRPRTAEFAGADGFRATVERVVAEHVGEFLDPERERFRVEYPAGKGIVQLVRAMQTRRDIPAAETFSQEVDMLIAIAEANRAYIERQGSEVRS